jgi:hypothetical protein
MSDRVMREVERGGGDIQGPLYKYLKREHARAWLTKGEIRIGTFSGFRKVEDLAEDIGDSEEGKRLLWQRPDIVDTSRPETMERIPKNAVVVSGGGRAVFHGTRFEDMRITVDYYMLSLSTEFSEEAMRKMDPEYDTCVRIDDPRSFFTELTRTLHRAGISSKLLGVEPCVYRDRTIHISDPDAKVSVQLLKDPRYAYQNEVRAIWEPRRRESPSTTLTALNVLSPEAARFCSSVDTSLLQTQMTASSGPHPSGAPAFAFEEFKGRHFENERIELDGCAFVDCTFKNCLLVFGATAPISLVNIVFDDVQWEFTKAAAMTTEFLAGLYRLGDYGRGLVEGTFETIRKGPPGQ